MACRGVSTRIAERTPGRRLFDMLRQGDTLVVRWVEAVSAGTMPTCATPFVVRTVINRMVLDGSTNDPMRQAVRDALIAFMAATAQATRLSGLASNTPRRTAMAAEAGAQLHPRDQFEASGGVERSTPVPLLR